MIKRSERIFSGDAEFVFCNHIDPKRQFTTESPSGSAQCLG